MADDHTLCGPTRRAAGFASYALLAPAGCVRPRHNRERDQRPHAIDLEAEYAKDHDDLVARVFIGMADGELNHAALSAPAPGQPHDPARREPSGLREYPGLDLYTRLYTDRDHFTVMPLVIGDGLQHVYADLIEGLAKPNW